MRLVTSRDNPLLVQLRRQLRQPAGYRAHGQVWVEGDHLCRAALHRGWPLPRLVATEAMAQTHGDLIDAAEDVVLVPPALYASLSALESPPGIAAVLDLPSAAAPLSGLTTVVLDGVQDAGNVGSILRSTAALGGGQVLALKGTAALWSPKVLRAGMGAHFGLRVVEGLAVHDLDALGLPLVATSSHAAHTLAEVALPRPCAWVFGHEGQGVSAELLARCGRVVRIPQPGGEESLNVAAAAAICLYESARQHADQYTSRSG